MPIHRRFIGLMCFVVLLLTSAAGAAALRREQVINASLRSEILALTKQVEQLKLLTAVAKSSSERTPSGEPPDKSPAPRAAPPPVAPVIAERVPSATLEEAPAAQTEYRVTARLSAIEKFVEVTEVQRERLRKKFRAEIRSRSAKVASPDRSQEVEDNEPESLEAILGEEDANFYREEVKRSFARAEQEEREKEVLLLVRRLSLNDIEEQQIRTAMEEVDAAIDRDPDAGAGGSMQEKVLQMLAENKLRSDLMRERLAEILPQEKYRSFIEMEAESAAADVEVFHGP